MQLRHFPAQLAGRGLDRQGDLALRHEIIPAVCHFNPTPESFEDVEFVLDVFHGAVVGKLLNEFQRMRGERRFLDRLARRMSHHAVSDIGRHRVIEQNDVLTHQRDVAAQVRQPQDGDVVAIEQDSAGGRIVEARDQIYQ